MSNRIYKEVTFDLSTLVKDIAMGRTGLPHIQRPFIWRNSKIRNLFDSMYRGYPVGYLLFWETERGQTSGHRTIGTDAKQLSPNLVIVDGQQRLTSLYAVIKGEPVVRSNYNRERIRIAFDPVKEKFAVTSPPIERDRSFIPDISKLWNEDTHLFQFAEGFVDGLRSVREVSDEEVKRVQDSIVKLKGLPAFQFTALQLSADVSEEDVAEVFVRINSEGKPLNEADFILTLMSVFWDDGRKALEDFCRLARVPTKGDPSPYNHLIEPSPDQMLRVVVGLAFYRARLAHVYSILRGKDLKTGVFSEDRREAQFTLLRQAQSKVLNLQYWHDFLQCVRQAGYRDRRMISSPNTLLHVYTLYLIGRTERHVAEHILRRVIAQWFFMSALTSRYTGSAESRMESDLTMAEEFKTPEEFIAGLHHECSVALTNDFWEVTLPNDLATSSARSPSLFAYEAALVSLNAPVLFDKSRVGEQLDPTTQGHRRIERHHLFPRSYLKKLGIKGTREINQIANYAYIEWSDNIQISDQSPAEYLPALRQRFNGIDLARMYRFHALPDNWEHMDYKAFLSQRRERMAKMVREAYNRLIGEGTPSATNCIDVAELVLQGEGDLIEFKSTLRMNLHTGEPDKRMELAVLRTLAGFLNKDGGTLVVGVGDEGSPVGLKVDGFENEDKMHLHLVNIVNSRMGAPVWAYMHANFEDFEEGRGRVLTVRCERARTPVYVKDGNAERFYVRTGPSTTELPVGQAMEYIRQRFG